MQRTGVRYTLKRKINSRIGEKEYTKEQLKSEIKKTIRQIKTSIKTNREMASFIGDFSPQLRDQIFESNEDNRKALKQCYECLGMVEAGELDRKLIK